MIVEDIALQLTPGIGAKGAAHLLEVFGDAGRIFEASIEELTGQAQLRLDLAQRIVRRKEFCAAERELKYCRRHGIVPIASTDPEYPPLLRDIPDYPTVLYLSGDPAVLSARCLSIVGTRKGTAYGETMCDRLVSGLAERVPDLAIVSGLAFGNDAAAHRAALASQVPTVAVVANPLPEVTPAQHTALAREIIAQGGALISENHSQTKQNGTGYLARNRIIAALSTGCLVVESPENGGSLVTAACADSYQRTVMALPGRVTDPCSKGTNHLITTRKAAMIRSAGDIIRELGWDLDSVAAARNPRPVTEQLTPDEAGLLACFRTGDPLPVEELAEQSGLDPGALTTLLVGLELAGAVRQLPGNRYMKIR